MRNDITVTKLLKAMNRLGHSVYQNDSKPYNLNIIGIRAADPIVNKFNCLMAVLWKHEGQWNLFLMKMTSLAGLKYLEKPTNPKGCAILKEGQYKGVYKLDLHNSKYLAVCQRLGDVTVYRDDDLDTNYDLIEGTEDAGMFGINIHRASSKDEVENVNGYSAGCQVIQSPNEFDVFIKTCQEAEKVWGNKFTYTLINENNII